MKTNSIHRLLVFTLLCSLLAKSIWWIMPPTYVFAQISISVTVDGALLSFDVPPTIRNGRTLVPMRAIFERLGATVDWNAASRTITARTSDQTIQLTIGSTTAIVNGSRVNLDVAAEIMNDRTLVPVRFISESLGAHVDWRADTRTVVITTGETETFYGGRLPNNLDLYELYSEVFIPYQELINNEFFPNMDSMEFIEWVQASKINILLARSQNEVPIYYAFFDIDGNGIPELLIGSGTHRDHITIFDVFTWHNGQVLYLFDYFLGERTNLVIHDNGVIEILGSGGAFTHGWSFYEISPDGYTPTLLNMVIRDGQPPIFTRGSLNAEEISESEFENIIMQYTGRMPFEPAQSSVSIEWRRLTGE